ncbi:hypothetical protein GCM10029992_34650 [Glycomyces albus]
MLAAGELGGMLLVGTIVMTLLILSSMLRVGGLSEFAIEDDYRAVPGLAAWLSMAASLMSVVAALLVVAKPAKLISVPVTDGARSGLTGELEELADLRDRGSSPPTNSSSSESRSSASTDGAVLGVPEDPDSRPVPRTRRSPASRNWTPRGRMAVTAASPTTGPADRAGRPGRPHHRADH